MTADPKTRTDKARGGYFEVVDRRPLHFGDREDFHVKAYTAFGELLLHTWNSGEHSMHMEVSALLSRGAHPRGATAEAAAKAVQDQNARLEQTFKRQRHAQP
jgi:hypothetical protein